MLSKKNNKICMRANSGVCVGMNIDRKLRLTAAFVGAGTRKDLAAAFRRINPATAFDVDRADKWLQGRSTPRQFSVYDDWIRLLDLPKTADWIADSDLETFIAEICRHHGRDRQQLERRAQAFGKAQANGHDARGGSLAGAYVCYSHSWSPYFRGQFIRGSMLIEPEQGQRLSATYTESLPTMRLQIKGQVIVTRRSLYIHVGGPADDTHFFCALFPFSPPGSVLGGYLTGTTVLGPDSQPSVTRMVLVRLKEPAALDHAGLGYLEPETSIPQDLERFEVRLEQPDLAEEHLRQFLTRDGKGGTDQIAKEDFQKLVDVFDRAWLGR